LASVLVVDDDADVLDIVASVVASAGHNVVKAGNGNEALNVLDGGDLFDLMITDIIMPGLNGFNLARMARMRRPLLRILYLTGFHEEAIAMRDAGGRYGKLLLKPIAPQDLQNEVDIALSIKRS
jgi:two-component system, cell cycle response regulator CpdR